MNMNVNKIAFVMSDEFVAMVVENINHYGVIGTARMAERRYQFRNPKLDGIDVTAEDVARAVNMHYGVGVKHDRLINVYNWAVRNFRKFVSGVKCTKDAVREAWISYRRYVTDNGLERLWNHTALTGVNSSAEREFGMICSNVAETSEDK